MKHNFWIYMIGISFLSYQSWANPTCNCGAEGHESDCCWEFNNGVLTISAAPGASNVTMKDFGPVSLSTDAERKDYHAQRPWNNIKDNVEHIVIEGLTNVGNRAFQYMNSVKSISMDNSLQDIAYCAFEGTGVTGELVIPNSVKHIDSGAFYNIPNMTSVIIPDSVETMGANIFGAVNHATKDSIQNLTIGADNLQKYLNSLGGFTDNAHIKCSSGNCAAVLSAWDAAHNTNYAGTISISVPQADGSTAIYKNGKLRYEGKRIYTVEEANQVSGKKNKVMIRYK